MRPFIINMWIVGNEHCDPDEDDVEFESKIYFR